SAIDGAEREAEGARRAWHGHADSGRGSIEAAFTGSALNNARTTGDAALVGKRQTGRVAERVARTARHAPLNAEAAGELSRGLDDACFDFDLRLRRIERGDEIGRALQPIGEIVDDQCV